MIPISKDCIMEYLDHESGILYKLRPLLGDAEYAYYSAIGILSQNIDHTPFIAEAEKQLDSENRGKEWGAGEKETETRKRAVLIATARKERAPEDVVNDIKREDAALSLVIDSVMVGWEKDGVVVARTASEKPSSMFRLNDKRKMFKVIMRLNGELSEEEEKN